MIELLKESTLFGRCTPEQLEGVAARCERCSYPAGACIIEAQTPANHLYVVEHGVVELLFTVTCYGVAQQIPVDRQLRGDVVGWSALTSTHTFTLSAAASRDATLLRIRSVDLEELFVDDAFGHVVMRQLGEIIARRFGVIQQMLIDVLQERVVR